jgi:two-component system sensor histidine kinase QseC
LTEVVRDRLAFLAELARASQVEIELRAESDVRLMAGIESLVSLIDNLVENAIKYSPAEAVVTVTVESAEGRAVLTVSDEGPGIRPERLARVFDRFYRAPDQVQTGSGLGLAIVKSAVERNGGTISLGTTSATHGLTVTVQLPLWIFRASTPAGDASASVGDDAGAVDADLSSPPGRANDLRIARKLS